MARSTSARGMAKRRKMTWQESDAKYKARGAALAIGYDEAWDDDLEEMNKGKVGRPYKYSDSMIAFVALLRVLIGKSYRVCWGIIDESWKGRDASHYATIWKRAGNVMPTFERAKTFHRPDGGVIRLAPDSAGIQHSNRGEWIRVKWNVKRGFFKLYILIDLDTMMIVAFSMTDMSGGDGAQLPRLLSKALVEYVGEGVKLPESTIKAVVNSPCVLDAGGYGDGQQTLLDTWMYGDEEREPAAEPAAACITVNGNDAQGVAEAVANEMRRIRETLKEKGIDLRLWADGGYDTRKVFSLLGKLGISPRIKVRADSNTRSKGVDRYRTLAVLQQLGGKGNCTNKDLAHMTNDERRANRKAWLEEMEYGVRWRVEIVISAFKRVFGESVRARTPRTAFIDIATKMAAYNRNLDMEDEIVRKMRSGHGRPGRDGTCRYGPRLEIVA